MPYSYVLLPGNGTTQDFTFNFGYLARAHIHVSVDTVDTAFTWLTDFSVQILPAPAAGTVIEIRRITPLTEPIVDWTDGTVLTEVDMDLNTLFSLFTAQEAQDGVEASIKQNAEGEWDGQGRATTNFADPTENTGLVTKGYFDTIYTPQLESLVTEATTQASNAASSASASQASAVASDNSADLAAAILATFKGQYLGPLASDPTVDANGDPVGIGDLYFNTTDFAMQVYTGTVWANAGSTIQGTINKSDTPVIATAGQTTFTIDGGYEPGYILVYLNGALIDFPDVNTSSGTDVVFTDPLAAGDEFSWVAFGSFQVANVPTIDETQWLGKAVGEVFYLRDDISGVAAPPTNNPNFRFIKLTAADAYNTGVLTSETVSGSAPLVLATAIISLAGSPINGAVVDLMNTTRRVLRSGNSGTVEQDALQNITGSAGIVQSPSFLGANGAMTMGIFGDTPPKMGVLGADPGASYTINFNAANSPGARTDIETHVKSIGATAFMRIK